ncbi:MAG: hypothetical protein JNK11_04815 [Alphaproteobacteria bacterium]|nr:hypothetical protein [Alphaproteobacteria bacterium]
MVTASCASVGSGPITLSRDATEFFWKQQVRRECDDYYLSADGTFIACDYCAFGRCSGGSTALTRCERSSGQACFIFAKRQTVLWNGPVTYSDTAPTPRADTRYKPPKVGLRIDTNRGPIVVVGLNGLRVATVDGDGRQANWCAGTFHFDPSSRIRIIGVHAWPPSCAPEHHDVWWTLKPKEWSSFQETRDGDVWGHSITYLGQDVLDVGGRRYPIEKFEHKRYWIGGRRIGETLTMTLWFAPDVGFVLRRDVAATPQHAPSVEAFVATKVLEP